MRTTISDGLKAAMHAKDKKRVNTLRLVSAAIKDRDISARTAGKGPLSDAEILEVISKMVKQRLESAKVYEEAGRLELASEEREEIAILEEFLPKQMDEDAVKSACQVAIGDIGAEGLRDMGKVMGELKSKYPGQMDFGKASCTVKKLLAEETAN